MKAVIGTHEFAYRNWMLMEPYESSYLTTDKRTPCWRIVCRPKVAQPNKLQHNPVQERCSLVVDGMIDLQGVGGSQELQ